MIVEAFVTILAALVNSLAGLFGSLTMPVWWTNVSGWLDQLGGYAAGFGQWLPISTAINAIGFVVLCMGLAFTIKVVRVVASFFTAGGGSAA